MHYPTTIYKRRQRYLLMIGNIKKCHENWCYVFFIFNLVWSILDYLYNYQFNGCTQICPILSIWIFFVNPHITVNSVNIPRSQYIINVFPPIILTRVNKYLTSVACMRKMNVIALNIEYIYLQGFITYCFTKEHSRRSLY